MKNIHLIMPFTRHENKEKLIEAYRPMGIILHPIMFQDETANFPEPWIFPVIIPIQSNECKVRMPCSCKRNYWLGHEIVIDNDYYITADDDDIYEAGVFDIIKQMDDDIVIISMKRGHNIPKEAILNRRYATHILYAKPENVRIGMIGSQQAFVKGKIFKQHLFNEESIVWDGEILTHYKDSGEQIKYRSDLFVLFNYYEPGRWIL